MVTACTDSTNHCATHQKPQSLGRLRRDPCRPHVPGIVHEGVLAQLDGFWYFSFERADLAATGSADSWHRPASRPSGIVVELPPLDPPQSLAIHQVVRHDLAALLVHVDRVVEVRLERGIVAVLEERLCFLQIGRIRLRRHRRRSSGKPSLEPARDCRRHRTIGQEHYARGPTLGTRRRDSLALGRVIGSVTDARLSHSLSILTPSPSPITTYVPRVVQSRHERA